MFIEAINAITRPAVVCLSPAWALVHPRVQCLVWLSRCLSVPSALDVSRCAMPNHRILSVDRKYKSQFVIVSPVVGGDCNCNSCDVPLAMRHTALSDILASIIRKWLPMQPIRCPIPRTDRIGHTQITDSEAASLGHVSVGCKHTLCSG